MATASSRTLPGLALLFFLAACASASVDDDAGGGGGDIDSGSVIIPDADLTPDAPGSDMPDAGTPDAAGMATGCMLYGQTGCNVGEACDLDEANLDTGGTICRAVTVQGGATSTCTGTTTCSAGFVCLGAAGESYCMEYCQSDATCDGTGGLCVIGIVYGANSTPVMIGGSQVKVCSNNCNPLDGVGCPTGFGCQVARSSTEMRNFTACDKAGAGTQGATCTANGNECAAGYSCINVSGASKCLKYCNKPGQSGTAAGCLAGQTCSSFTIGGQAPTIGATTYGVCQ